MAKISDLARHVGLPFEGNGDLEVDRIMGLDLAVAGNLTFVRGAANVEQALASPALAMVAPEGVALPGKTVIRSAFPHLTIVQLTPVLHPRKTPPAGIDPRAVVGKDCRIDPTAIIHPLASIADRVTIGPRTEIFPGVYIGEGASVGADCLIAPGAHVPRGSRLEPGTIAD